MDEDRGQILLVEVASAHSPVGVAANSITSSFCHGDKKRRGQYGARGEVRGVSALLTNSAHTQAQTHTHWSA